MPEVAFKNSCRTRITNNIFLMYHTCTVHEYEYNSKQLRCDTWEDVFVYCFWKEKRALKSMNIFFSFQVDWHLLHLTSFVYNIAGMLAKDLV